MPPRSGRSNAAPADLTDRSLAISFVQANPKKRNSAAGSRYEGYKRARTVGEALQAGAKINDLKYDLEKGFMELPQRDTLAAQASPQASPQSAPASVAAPMRRAPSRRGSSKAGAAASSSGSASMLRAASELPRSRVESEALGSGNPVAAHWDGSYPNLLAAHEASSIPLLERVRKRNPSFGGGRPEAQFQASPAASSSSRQSVPAATGCSATESSELPAAPSPPKNLRSAEATATPWSESKLARTQIQTGSTELPAAASPPKNQQAAEAAEKALEKLCMSCVTGETQTPLMKLLEVFEKIEDDPTDASARILNLEDEDLQLELICHDGAMDLLDAAGFSQSAPGVLEFSPSSSSSFNTALRALRCCYANVSEALPALAVVEESDAASGMPAQPEPIKAAAADSAPIAHNSAASPVGVACADAGTAKEVAGFAVSPSLTAAVSSGSSPFKATEMDAYSTNGHPTVSASSGCLPSRLDISGHGHAAPVHAASSSTAAPPWASVPSPRPSVKALPSLNPAPSTSWSASKSFANWQPSAKQSRSELPSPNEDDSAASLGTRKSPWRCEVVRGAELSPRGSEDSPRRALASTSSASGTTAGPPFPLGHTSAVCTEPVPMSHEPTPAAPTGLLRDPVEEPVLDPAGFAARLADVCGAEEWHGDPAISASELLSEPVQDEDSGCCALDVGEDVIRLRCVLGIIRVKQELPEADDADAGCSDATAPSSAAASSSAAAPVLPAPRAQQDIRQMLLRQPGQESNEEQQQEDAKCSNGGADQSDQGNQDFEAAQLASYEANEAEKKERAHRDRELVLQGDFSPCYVLDQEFMESLMIHDAIFQWLETAEHRTLLFKFLTLKSRSKQWYREAAETFFAEQQEHLIGMLQEASAQVADISHFLTDLTNRVEEAIYGMLPPGRSVPEIFAPEAYTSGGLGCVDIED